MRQGAEAGRYGTRALSGPSTLGQKAVGLGAGAAAMGYGASLAEQTADLALQGTDAGMYRDLKKLQGEMQQDPVFGWVAMDEQGGLRSLPEIRQRMITLMSNPQELAKVDPELATALASGSMQQIAPHVQQLMPVIEQLAPESIPKNPETGAPLPVEQWAPGDMLGVLDAIGAKTKSNPQQIKAMAQMAKGNFLDGLIGGIFPGWMDMTGTQKMFMGLAFGAGIIGLMGMMGGNSGMGMGGLLGAAALGGLGLFGKNLPGQMGQFFGAAPAMPQGFDPGLWGMFNPNMQQEIAEMWDPNAPPEQQVALLKAIQQAAQDPRNLAQPQATPVSEQNPAANEQERSSGEKQSSAIDAIPWMSPRLRNALAVSLN